MERDFLKKRAESFLRDAKFAFKEKRWFAVAFHLEQASQLYLKYYLFRKLKDFPKTHSLKELLINIGKTYSCLPKIKKFIKSKERVINDLEEAYLTSRYLPVEFNKEEILEMKKFVKELKQLLKKL